MKRIALILTALAFSGAAIAQTAEIRRTETPLGSSTTVTKQDDGMSTRRSMDTTGSVGCETKTVTKENEDGDRKTKTRTDC